jgi:hypothetical protein
VTTISPSYDNPDANYEVDGPQDIFREVEHLIDKLYELADRAKDAEPGPLPEVPEELRWERGIHRSVRSVETTDAPTLDYLSLKDARALIARSMRDYLATYEPGELLLVKARPGLGKTHASVRLAEELAAHGKRVLYCGPRHDFFADVLGEAQHPEWWYEWQPRDHKDADGEHDLCVYPDQIGSWMSRGYQGSDFCGRVCGWKYMQNRCAYHKQKKLAARKQHWTDDQGREQKARTIVFGQHAHLWTGLPEHPGGPFDVVIVDENPMQAFLREWKIPGLWIMPRSMDYTDPLTELVHNLSQLAATRQRYEGPVLMDALGGAAHVREVLETWHHTPDEIRQILSPYIRHANDVEDQPYGHLYVMVPMLLREAYRAERGLPWLPRVSLFAGDLYLATRRSVNEKFASLPMIWLDGTAEEHIAAALTGRNVQVVDPPVAIRGTVYQVTDRANGKHSLVQDGVPTSKVEQLRRQIDHVIAERCYTQPGIITFEALEETFSAVPQRGHFFGARGSNEFIGCDAIFVAGTPQPQLSEIPKMAKMIYLDRDEPFNITWSIKDVPYLGQPNAYPVAGYWHDQDLHAVLRQQREAEIEQAAHRSRPMLYACDIWLLTNIPIASLPPDRLISVRKLYKVPTRVVRGEEKELVDPDLWKQFTDLAEQCLSDNGSITTNDVVKVLGICDRTAKKFIDLLVRHKTEAALLQ